MGIPLMRQVTTRVYCYFTLPEPPEKINDSTDHVDEEELSDQHHRLRPLSEQPNVLLDCLLEGSAERKRGFRDFLDAKGGWGPVFQAL